VKHYDVVIVGAGLAGLQLARLLSRQDIHVLLVDRKPAIEKSIHTTGIFVRRTLEDFDIPEDCLGPAIQDVTLYSPSRRSMELRSTQVEFRIGRMAQLYSRFLNHCLRNGVEWMPQTRYSGHQVLKGESVIRLDTPRFSRWVKTRFLIGADGANSRVARDLGLDLNREWIVGVEDVFTSFRPVGPPRLHCFLEPELAPGYLAWVAHDGEETHIGVGGYSSLFDPQRALETFRKSLSGTIELNQACFIERRGGRIPVGGVLLNIANKNGLLVGDAAGAVSPLTAGGLDPCMRLSTYAARVVATYLETQNAEVLNDYSGDLFRARFIARIWMRRLLNSSRQRQFMEAAFQIMRLPLFNHLARHVFFGRGSFPDIKDELAPQPVF
jgi:flavin-dependent dehydrogenase